MSTSVCDYLLIDTSYWIFYRYFAIIQWWKHAKPEIILPESPYECEEFVEKFVKTFTESIDTFKKKLKIHKQKTKCTVIACRDCPRKEIWRNDLYNSYKETRIKDDSFMGGPFFKSVYANNNKMLYDANVDHVLKHDRLEGDDVIAITKNIIREKYPNANIIILANDHDYLQLMDENTNIINFQMKNLKESKKVFLEADKNLFYKIVLGDKSDNIMPVFKKCGPKTVEKYYNDREEFEKALQKEDCRAKYERNIELVSFAKIPYELKQEYIKNNNTLLSNL